MIGLYLHTNILIAAAWIVFQLLPKSKMQYRTAKKIAQGLLFSALVAVPALSLMPDNSFPRYSASEQPTGARDVDAGSGVVAPVKQVFRQAINAGETKSQNADNRPLILLAIFLSGMVFMLSRRVKHRFFLKKLINTTLPLHEIGRTSVVVSDQIVVPFSVWLQNRAYVVLPAELVPYREDFRIALRHEVEHHRRRDTFWAVALEYLVCGFYLNPAVYLWRKTILQLQELACDEALIGRMGISKQAYGSCLLRVAEMALGRRFMCAGTTCMIPASESNSHSFLKRRIKMFALHERSKAKKALSVAFGTLGILTVIGGAYFAQAASRPGFTVNPGTASYDPRIQAVAEESLAKGMQLNGASAGFAIVADPHTGKILAVANANNGFDRKLKGDWALSYALEPASAIKPLIVASALQNHFVKIDDQHDCENGKYTIGGETIHDAGRWKKLSTVEAITQSSNICTIKIGRMMGAENVEAALRDFGIGGGETVKDFPGAKAGTVPKTGSLPDDGYIARVSLGLGNRAGFHVTALEMVQAYGAIANGGKLMKAIEGDGQREVVSEVMTPSISAQMRDVLRKVVTEGTASGINGSSIALAGKTSSLLMDGGRNAGGFIGYAPAENPKLVVFVELFDLKGKNRTGAVAAAPVFREIVEKSILNL